MKFFIIILLFITFISCSSRKEEKVKVPLGEVGILVNSNGEVLVQDLIKEGTYTFTDSIYELVTFSVFSQISFSASFQTSDSKQFTGYVTIKYLLDTTNVIEMYKGYRDSYYEIEYEPNFKRIFRETIRNYSSDSLKNEDTFNHFYDRLALEINQDLPNKFLFITDLKIDSIVQKKHVSPFNTP